MSQQGPVMAGQYVDVMNMKYFFAINYSAKNSFRK